MVRGTTPEYTLCVSGKDLTEDKINVTISQGDRNVKLEGERLSVTYISSTGTSTITFRLTQEETLTFKTGRAQVQVKYMEADGYVDATTIGDITVHPILNEDVMTNE